MKPSNEWEENFFFDADDPDFGADGRPTSGLLAPTTGFHMINSLMIRVPSAMSLASIHNTHFADLRSSISGNSLSMSSSLSDLVGSPLELSSDNVITIEELRVQMGSCFSCGVSWAEDHVSLDCVECGGYSVERPCPLCDGMCGEIWKRDYTMSHASGRARWQGACLKLPAASLIHHHLPTTAGANILSQTTSVQTCGASQLLAHELCARLEQLSASAQT